MFFLPTSPSQTQGNRVIYTGVYPGSGQGGTWKLLLDSHYHNERRCWGIHLLQMYLQLFSYFLHYYALNLSELLGFFNIKWCADRFPNCWFRFSFLGLIRLGDLVSRDGFSNLLPPARWEVGTFKPDCGSPGTCWGKETEILTIKIQDFTYSFHLQVNLSAIVSSACNSKSGVSLVWWFFQKISSFMSFMKTLQKWVPVYTK